MWIDQCEAEIGNHSQVLNFADNITLCMIICCPEIFVGLLCWDTTPAGTDAYKNCPAIDTWSPEQKVYKHCDAQETWNRNPEEDSHWTNYTTCIDMKDARFRDIIFWINYGGNTASFISSVYSLFVMRRVRKITTDVRIKIHQNTFSAIIMNYMAWVPWMVQIVHNVSTLKLNPIWCSIPTLINVYFMCACFFWLFCEGLNMYSSVVMIFINRVVTMKIFFFIGWVVPLLITIAYGTYRIYAGDLAVCMIDQSYASYAVIVPVVIATLISFLLTFGNVIENYRADTRADQLVRRSTFQSMKFFITECLVKVLLGVVNLFSVYYIVFPIHSPVATPWQKVYAVFLALITSLQGFFASIMFCFKDKVVQDALKERRNRRIRRNNIMEMIEQRRRLVRRRSDQSETVFTAQRADEIQPTLDETEISPPILQETVVQIEPRRPEHEEGADEDRSSEVYEEINIENSTNGKCQIIE